MHRVALHVIAVSLIILIADVAAHGETMAGAIKRFVKFPVQTYELNGLLSKTRLEQGNLPAMSDIYVTGLWPDRKLLLIDLGGSEQAYYILYSSVEMNDQALWDDRMRASGNLVCLGGDRRQGSSAPTVTPATKGFASPC